MRKRKLVQRGKIPKKLIPGIQIVEVPGANRRTTRFEFKVTEGSFADPLFYSSPRLRELLKKFPPLKGRNIGYTSYFFFSRKSKKPKAAGGRFSVRSYPFENLKSYSDRGKGSFIEVEEFRGKFIASELQKKTHREMIKRHGEIEVMPAYYVSQPGRRQMAARGIKLINRRHHTTASNMISKINMVKRKERAKRRVRK